MLVVDLDATIVICHSEKQQAAPTFKRTFGYHPLLAFCDNNSEFLAGVLRRGNAGANAAADHIKVLDQALAQIPDPHRHGRKILIRADTADCTKAILAHVRDQQTRLVSCEFSVGWAITDRERAAIDVTRRRCGPMRSTPTAATATAPDWPSSPVCCPPRRWRDIRPGRG